MYFQTCLLLSSNIVFSYFYLLTSHFQPILRLLDLFLLLDRTWIGPHHSSYALDHSMHA